MKAVALLSLAAVSCASAGLTADRTQTQATAPADLPGASSLPLSASDDTPDASADVGRSALDRHGQSIPASYSCVATVLEYLATRNESRGAFDPKKTLAFDTVLFGSWVPDDGIEFTRELSGPSIQKLPRIEVLTQLARREGTAFERLAHLGNAYSMRHPNHSKLSFTPLSGETVNVRMGVAKYDLAFSVHQGNCSLLAVHYLVREEE
jgi:hypothetical protein